MKNYHRSLVFIGLVFILFVSIVLLKKELFQPSLVYSQAGNTLAFMPVITSPPFTQPPGSCNTTPLPPSPGSIVVDHTSVDLFDYIPEQYLQAAANTDMFFMDRSVGGNINDGLSCLGYASDEAAPNHCSRADHADPQYSVDECVVSWSRAGGYDRSRWDFNYWDAVTGSACDFWYNKVDCFMNHVGQFINQYDVVSFQFSYLSVDPDSTIADQPGGYFYNNANRTDVFDQEAFEAQHPDKIFIYWTTSLSRGIGSDVSEAFNEQMRQYARDNDKILFDVADILSHDPDGNPCYDNRDGIPYSNGNNSENYPNDGLDLAAICPHYTTETDGGHLGSVSAGKIRVAKAFWVLMARLNGWDGMIQ